jgi:hypothetical protein
MFPSVFQVQKAKHLKFFSYFLPGLAILASRAALVVVRNYWTDVVQGSILFSTGTPAE